jgi:hypothetical protein
VGRRGVEAFDDSGAGTVVTDDAAQVLHHGERKRRVRWGSRRAEEAWASGSLSGGTTATAQRKIREGSGDFGVQGRWTESREYGGGGGVLELGREGAERKKGNGTTAGAFECARRVANGKRRGGGGSVPRGGQEWKRKRGALGTAWDSAVARQRPAVARPRHARAARRGHVVWSAEQGRGEGTDRCAEATVPGGANSI